MEIKLLRYSSQSQTTLGVMYIDGEFECYTLEDCYREVKIKHETRIPCGEYVVKLREFGGHYNKYSNKYDRHEGMLWLQDVPNFTDILIHIGNDKNATSGCILVGSTANCNNKEKGFISDSTSAYLDMYFKVLKAFKRGEEVKIKIKNID